MMRCCGSVLIWYLALPLLPLVQGLFQDEVGQLDFLLATAGHSTPITFVHVVDNDLIVTTDQVDHVAARRIQNGELIWRRRLSAPFVASARDTLLVTVHDDEKVAAWDALTGTLLWDVVLDNNHKGIEAWPFKAVGNDDTRYVAVSVGSELRVYTENGKLTTETSASRTAVQGARSEATVALSSLAQEALCTAAEMRVVVDRQDFTMSSTADKQQKAGRVPGLDMSGNEFHSVTTTKCSKDGMIVLVTTVRGTTLMAKVSATDHAVTTLWQQEEGLANVASTLIVDASHPLVDETANSSDALSFSSRLQSQAKALAMALSWSGWRTGGANNGRQVAFGFLKTAILLSPNYDRLYGLNLGGEERGKLVFVLDLEPCGADSHRLVHGGVNAIKGTHGIGAEVHSHHMLVLSSDQASKKMHWKCLDGTDGSVQSSGVIDVASPVAQIIPFANKATAACHQGAMLLLENGSVHSIPEDSATSEAQISTLSTSENGLYTHRVDFAKGHIESLQLTVDGTTISTLNVGQLTLPGERIVAVSYPSNSETMQSPCNVLGDESLLLKYVNPHLAAVVTLREPGSKDDALTEALKEHKKQNAYTGRRKPAGAGPSNAVQNEEEPNLFVNVVDVVTGRVLYRVGHANAVTDAKPSVAISENWIFYSYRNSLTRRSDVGVLSLYEGMIGTAGLTMFTKPDQSHRFSSLDAKESKPQVLAKTYSMSAAITALGVTTTRSGISGRKVVAATAEGQIFAMERKMFDPRRPLGQLKDHEKKEGLHQYTELIATIPFMAVSHEHTVEGVKGIVSAPTDLESQTFILAVGGPDVFCSRYSPSRGFDLLPDSFNHALLAIVVLALLASLAATSTMASKKIVKQGWV